MTYMFYGCSALTNLNASGWDTSSVTSMTYMFYGCSALTTIDVSGWDTSSVKSMSGMFYDCSALTTLDLSSWDTSSVESMGNMFRSCSALTTIDVSSWDTSSVTYISNMFYGCYNLTTIYAGDDWSTAAVTESFYMFLNCTAIKGQSGTTYDSSKIDATMANWETGYLTYKRYVKPAPYLIQNTSLIAIADAIRAKTGSTGAMTPAEMAAGIASLETRARLAFSTVRGTAPDAEGAFFAQPDDPSFTGYGFVGWYSDSALTQAFDWGAEAETATVYAKWSINAPTVSHPDIMGDGEAHALGTVTAAGEGQSVCYSADGSTWQSACPEQSADGTYTTYWKVTADSCDDLTGSFTTTISSDPVTDDVVTKLNAAATSRNLSTLTLDELGAVAGDLEANGTSSKAYSAAKACAQAGAYRTTTYNNTTVYMTLVSVLHDEDADGNALGLTWMLSGGAVSEDALMGTGDGVDTMAMNSSNTNTDGWGASAGRTTLNSTVLSNLNESGLTALIKARKVPYGPNCISISAFVDYTTDKLWLMSYHEVYGLVTSSYSDRYDMTRYKYLANEGGQMDWFSANNVSQSNFSKLVGGNTTRFLRSCSSYIVGNSFGTIYYGDGGPSYDSASYPKAVFPCFSM